MWPEIYWAKCDKWGEIIIENTLSNKVYRSIWNTLFRTSLSFRIMKYLGKIGYVVPPKKIKLQYLVQFSKRKYLAFIEPLLTWLMTTITIFFT